MPEVNTITTPTGFLSLALKLLHLDCGDLDGKKLDINVEKWLQISQDRKPFFTRLEGQEYIEKPSYFHPVFFRSQRRVYLLSIINPQPKPIH